MSYNFSLENTQEMLYSFKNNISKIELPNNLGYMKVQEESISNEVSLMKLCAQTFGDLNISSKALPKSLIIRITLDGNMDYYSHSHQNYFKNSIYIDYINGSDGTFKTSKDINYKSILLMVKYDFLEKYLFNNIKDEYRTSIEKNYKNNLVSTLKATLSNSKTLFLANEIYNSPFKGDLESLFLRGKVYDLIHNEFSSLISEKKDINTPALKFSKADIDALHKAKKIMMTSKEKISIPELSRKVALNEYKLKYGFKHLFNTTPHSVMLERRMYEAKELLLTSDLNASEVADTVGYKYIQSFSMAFSKFFGQTPKEIINQRKRYY